MTTLPYVQIGEGPDYTSVPVYNAGQTTIYAGSPLVVDSANPMNSAGTNNQIAVATPVAAASALIVGIARQDIPATSEGRMVPIGPVVTGVCDVAGVTAGAQVAAGTTSPYTALTMAAGGSAAFGIALASGASGETIPYVLTYIAYAHS